MTTLQCSAGIRGIEYLYRTEKIQSPYPPTRRILGFLLKSQRADKQFRAAKSDKNGALVRDARGLAGAVGRPRPSTPGLGD